MIPTASSAEPTVGTSALAALRAGRLTSAVAGDLARDPRLHALVERFLLTPVYRRSFCADLIDLARARAPQAWPLRRLAVLMLEHQILKLRAADAEILFLLRALEIIPPRDASARFERLRRRLARLDRVHAAIDGVDTSEQALADFIAASRTDCRLTLARYLFAPDDVVEHIVAQMDTSTGLSDAGALDQPYVRAEIARCYDHLPPYEARILSALCRRSPIYWVSPATSSRINGLVEYPLGTVALVIKPPGSDLEIEVKRAGMRGGHRWHVLYSRDGDEVPQTHRLQGGSMGYYARWEAASAASLAHVYRLIHDAAPPISRSVAIASIYGVPADGSADAGTHGGRERHVVDFFAHLEGPSGRDETCRAMQRSVIAFCREMKTRAMPIRDDVELAAQFLGQVAPTQATLVGTSSFRLDRLVAHLAADGADRYFDRLGAAGAGGAWAGADARMFADEVLEEILGVVTPGGTPFHTHAQYVEAIFASPENRARADRQYRRAMRQIGTFWGTLLGLRAYTYGESFVARNVGVKSVWQNGEWTAQLLFMDHDGTFLSGQRTPDFHPLSALPGMTADDMHVWGFRSQTGETITGDVALLRTLYRIDERVEGEAQSMLRDELRRAFQRTRRAIRDDPSVRCGFAAAFLDRFDDWDAMVLGFLEIGEDRVARETWRARTSRWLDDKGYADNARREYLRAVERHETFLRKYAWLY